MHPTLEIKFTEANGFPGGIPGSDSSPSIKLLMSDSFAWLISSSDGCLTPQSDVYHVEREINILRTPLGVTAMATPHFTRGLMSHQGGFRFNDVFRNDNKKRKKELEGRRGSGPEQLLREQKGKKDTQNEAIRYNPQTSCFIILSTTILHSSEI